MMIVELTLRRLQNLLPFNAKVRPRHFQHVFKFAGVGLVGPDVLRRDDFVEAESVECAGYAGGKGRLVYV